MQFDHQVQQLVGEYGMLPVAEQDEVTKKLAMLIEGECEGLSRSEAARKYGYTRQRYAQLLYAYQEHGSAALSSKPRGPKRNYRRTDELVRQVIRHRFLDPDASAEVIGQKLRQTGFLISTRSVERVIAGYGLQKKLYQCRPHHEPRSAIDTCVSRKRRKPRDCDPASIERGVRQLLANKVSGNLAGIWLLVAEHLRLGTWDLLCGWTRKSPECVEPRLAMQLVHEAAVCTRGIRAERTLHERAGFELANGLPFVATDRRGDWRSDAERSEHNPIAFQPSRSPGRPKGKRTVDRQ